jgi:hypothetical protein
MTSSTALAPMPSATISWSLAAEFARRSPDWEMRASLRLVSLG